MFCSETIKKAFYLCYGDMPIEDFNCFFLFSPCIEFHTTDGCWLVLQTEHHYIKIGADGVECLDGMEKNLFPQYDIMPLDDEDEDPPITSIHTSTFMGERILDVSKDGKVIKVRFDHFSVRVYAYSAERFWHPQNSQYIPMRHFERYLTRKCDCGGSGEIMLDHVDDFIVRCSKCHCVTWATFDCMAVVADWNNGETPIHFDTSEERFWPIAYEPVARIAMSKRHTCYDDKLYDCESLIIELDDRMFEISSQMIDEENYDFSFQEIGNYNPESWPYRINATEDVPIIFLGKETDNDKYPALRYKIGNKALIVTANDSGSIMFGWVRCEGEIGDDNSLFNDIYGRNI